MVDHFSFVDIVSDFLIQDMDQAFDGYLQAIFTSWRDLMAGIRITTSNVAKADSATFSQDVSPIPTTRNGQLIALSSEKLATMSPKPLGSSDAPPLL